LTEPPSEYVWKCCRKLTNEKLVNTESLLIDTNRLQGLLPSDLGQLNVNKLYAHRNQLQGAIPEAIWGNTMLRSLRLDENSFTGTLSGSVGNLVNATELNLDQNALVGPLPLLIGLLSSLGRFWRPCFYTIRA
jgi:hypothetical protein